MLERNLPAIVCALLALAAPALAQRDACLDAAELAAKITGGGASWGDLPVGGHYVLDEARLEEGRLHATVTTLLDVRRLAAERTPRLGKLCVALVVDDGGELRVVDERAVDVPELADAKDLEGVAAWRYVLDADLPEETTQMLVIVQEPALRAWGAFVAEDTGEPLPRPGADAVRVAAAGSLSAWYDVLRAGGGRRSGGRGAEVVVRLVPPREQPATGSTRFDAITTSEMVRKVVFELDGEEAEVERHRPFVARLDLARPARVQTVRAIAYDSEDRVLGEDTIRVNELDVPFRVRISSLVPRADGVDVEAQVSVPPGAALESVELYLNEELVRRFDAPPFAGRVPGSAFAPEDYVRVAAALKDGSTIDDVVLLASPTLSEEVEVNLVELFVVVSDDKRRPVGNLSPKDFTVVDRGEARQVASFAYADDVSLLLGLVIDTSGSMGLVMHDTKKAAAKFLGQTVLPQDRAFLVDFDRRPRLLQDTSEDVTELMMALGLLQAQGTTAMYDAIIFSMLQFEKERGRKALVVLTDGDDVESRYGPKDCVELGERLGVPIYIIGLGGLDSLRRTYSTNDLDRVTSKTGGRLYFVDSLEELNLAYAEINAELRSQYTLSFYAQSDLSDADRRRVEVRLARPGLEARTVFGTTSRNP